MLPELQNNILLLNTLNDNSGIREHSLTSPNDNSGIREHSLTSLNNSLKYISLFVINLYNL